MNVKPINFATIYVGFNHTVNIITILIFFIQNEIFNGIIILMSIYRQASQTASANRRVMLFIKKFLFVGKKRNEMNELSKDMKEENRTRL